MADQQDIFMGNVVGGAGGWTGCIDPALLMNNRYPSVETALDLSPPTQRRHGPRPLVRQPTYAEVALLPHQQAVWPNSLHPSPLPAIGLSYPAQGQYINPRARRDHVPIAPATPPAPIYRLDMHQEVPIERLMTDDVPHTASNPPPTLGGIPNRGVFTNNWLQEPQQPRDFGEPAVVRDGAISPLSPRMLRSPALSVSGHSDRTDRSTRRARRENHSHHRCNHPNCGEGFNSAADLRKHINGVHGRYEDRPYACALCLKRFRYPKDLDRHQATHQPRAPKYWCIVSGCPWEMKGFPRKDNYDRHMEGHYRADSGVQMSRSTSRT